VNPFEQLGRGVGTALAGVAAALAPGDSPAPPRPVPAIVMPDTVPLPRPRPDFEVATAPGAVPGAAVPAGAAPAGLAPAGAAPASAGGAEVGAAPAGAPQPSAAPAPSPAPTQVAALGIPIPRPRPDDLGAFAAEGDALPEGGDVAEAAPPPEGAPAAGRFAFAAPESAPEPAPFAAVGAWSPARAATPVEPAAPPAAPEAGQVAALTPMPPVGGLAELPPVVPPGEDHQDGLGVAPPAGVDADVGAVVGPEAGNGIADPPPAVPEEAVAALPPAAGADELGAIVLPLPRPRPETIQPERPLGALVLPLPRPRPDRAGAGAGGVQVAALPQSTPALIARLNDNPPDPACIARLQELGVEFEILDPIATDTGCGTSQPILVRALREGAVTLSPPATLDCAMAETLVEWMDEEVQPSATEAFEGRVTGIQVAASYSCRGVNGATSGPLSEHAYANAIDVSAFEIAGETEIAVLAPEDPESATAAFLGEIRGAACDHFHTVLGPGSDPAHWNHFHLDLAPRGRNGDSRYCE
jgi:hypothetical protein